MLDPTRLELSGDRLAAVYRLDEASTDAAKALAAHICVEQTVEFPADLIPPDDDISTQIIGRIEHFDRYDDHTHHVTISYAVECTAYQLPQLVNVLFGNISLLPGIRLEALELPESLLAAFPGPRFGVAGLRERFGVADRPMLATALKPMGIPLETLAAMAYDFAAAGIEIIKDDHGLASQPFADFRRRVELCAASIARANTDHGTSAAYFPSLNVPADEVFASARFVRDCGATGMMVLPGLQGYDTARALAADDDLSLMMLAHPALLGTMTSPHNHGIGHGVVFGTLMRLAGADVSVFPNHSGRFSFTPSQCTQIATALSAPLGALNPAFPAPAGGMSVERIPEMVGFYGNDLILLIGGALHRGSRQELARAMRETVISVTS